MSAFNKYTAQGVVDVVWGGANEWFAKILDEAFGLKIRNHQADSEA